MSEYSDGKRCSICNAHITNDNPDGIGFSCRKAYYKARYVLFMKDMNRRNAYYRLETEPIMFYFESLFKNIKFKSQFRKKFFPSIIEQYKDKKYLSKKQKEIILSWLSYKNEWIMKEDQLFDYISSQKREMVNNFILNLNDTDRIELRDLTNKMRETE